MSNDHDDRPIETTEDEAQPVTLASLSERTKVFEMLSMPERLARAERALIRAGYTYLEGAAEWKPPLGARPTMLAAEPKEVEPTEASWCRAIKAAAGICRKAAEEYEKRGKHSGAEWILSVWLEREIWALFDACPETAPAPPAVLPQDLIDADRWRMAESLYMGFDFSYQLADDKEVSVLLLKLPERVGAGAALEMSIDALIAKARSSS